ncbi:Wzz/FepE/Etk N-terminal domain-containing protein [Kyrpidia sp.]|uniref:Wzz/FepE/Etk N-terminal domain-containing protein n=1 Tax=Kyrpidia sp. TaxID=2073077 RepID=UPI00258C3018|nr:Wzz/FepE/Etk N-terminal domain-containing protein [Kyrpidia sp.]MCL6576967.1 hypothetical protein [Kyrpidia sp.]
MNEQQMEDVVDLRDLLRALGRQIPLIALVTAVVAVLGAWVSFRGQPAPAPTYTATAAIYVQVTPGAAGGSGPGGPGVAAGSAADAAQAVDAVLGSDLALMQSQAFQQAVARAYAGGTAGSGSAGAAPGGVVGAGALPDGASLSVARSGHLFSITATDRSAEGATTLAGAAIDVLGEMMKRIPQPQSLSVVSAPAAVEQAPAAVSHSLAKVAVAVVLGLILGAGAALVREYTTPMVRTVPEVERHLGARVLSAVRRPAPAVDGAGASGDGTADGAHPGSIYRALRVNVAFAAGDRVPRVLAVAGCVPGADSRVTAASLARVEAEAGRRTLLIDWTGSGGMPANWRSKVQPTGVEGLERLCVGAGEEKGGPGVDEQIAALVDEARRVYDQVVIGGPALLGTVEGRIFCHVADGVLVVLSGGRVRKEAVEEAARLLDLARARVLGAVLWDADGPARGRLFARTRAVAMPGWLERPGVR